MVFLLRGLTTMCQKSTAHEQRRSRGESRKLRFGSNRTAPKFDRRDNMIFTVHLGNRLIDENTPLGQSTIETCLQEAYKYQKVTKISCDIDRVKVRSILTGLRHDDERDDDRSHRRVSIMSSLDAG